MMEKTSSNIHLHVHVMFQILQVQKISILPPQKGLEFPGGRVCKTKKIEEMYETYLEFPEGWRRGLRKNLFCERYGYFLELHICNSLVHRE